MKSLGLIALIGVSTLFANDPVGPRICSGEVGLSIAGFYWNAHQDGMEYAIDSAIAIPVINPTTEQLGAVNHLVDARYESPNSNWEFGFTFAIDYISPCDGWDVELSWTHFHTRSSTHSQASVDDNHILVTLFSAFAPQQGGGNFARDIDADWKLKLDLLDLELGRDFWASKYLSIRPHVGIRFANIRQDFELEQKGGSWSPRMSPAQDPFNNFVDIDNDFKGAGLRFGMDSTWNFGCGWSLLAQFATALVYGKFDIGHDEFNRLSIADYDKTNVLTTKNQFRALRAILDLFLGIQWTGVFCDCNYGIKATLGYEQHLFFHQNQMWRVVRIGDTATADIPNNTGENVFHQRRGNLDTQGITLRVTAFF